MTKEQFIKRLAEELSIDAAQLKDDVRLKSLSAWDSMGQVATVGMLDDALGYDAPQGALQKCETVADLVALVADRLEK